MTVPHKVYNTSRVSGYVPCGYHWWNDVTTEWQPRYTVDDLSLEPGLDQMVRGEINYEALFGQLEIVPALDHFELNWGILPGYPNSYNLIEIAAGEDSQGIMYLKSFISGTGPYLNKYQDDLVDNGLYMKMTNFDPGGPDGPDEEVIVYINQIFNIKIFYFNPIVNSISRLWAPTAGGVAVVLTGLGFNNTESELDTGGPSKGNWADEVDTIEFIGLQGQGTTSLTRGGGDFTLDSNTQITIPANKFPALDEGTYEINLKKLNVDLGAATTITGYAGDWACDSAGKVFSSTRITFYITDTYVAREFRERKAPLILTDWHLQDRSDGSEVMKYYAMDYLRCTDRVYKGNLSAISSIPRGFEGKTGLFKISDLTLDLANNDLEFSKLLAGTTILKNKIVKVYQAYADEPFGWRSHIISLLIDDYSLEDDIFKVKLKDITQKYFRAKTPRQICTADHEINDTDDYSNIHPDSIGASVPELLGLCSLTLGEFRGAVEAICIDTVNYKYVAANRALKEITEVYSDDPVAVDPGDYTVNTEEDGRTYITFDADQGDKKVTFNCKGYIYGGLNSDNGYVQNPAYIILYLLIVILKIPPTLIDFASFIEVANIYDGMGEAEAGKLILQDEQDPMDVLQDLLAGSKCYIGKDGRITLGRKSISNYSTNNSDPALIIFRQLDAIGKAVREYNMRDAINAITAEYDYIPTWDIFKSSASKRADAWIGPFDPEQVVVEDNLLSRVATTSKHRRAWTR